MFGEGNDEIEFYSAVKTQQKQQLFIGNATSVFCFSLVYFYLCNLVSPMLEQLAKHHTLSFPGAVIGVGRLLCPTRVPAAREVL